jgi:single-strand DNA-binding protein
MAGSINRVILIGNLTRDPETRQAGSTTVCTLRLAVNDRVKDQSSGEWGDRPNYFDVDVFGSQGELCGKYLAKGRQVAVEGKLRWREWETQDGQKRSAVSVVAGEVQFIGPREGGAPQGAPRESGGGTRFAPPTDVAEADFAGDDDIPF